MGGIRGTAQRMFSAVCCPAEIKSGHGIAGGAAVGFLVIVMGPEHAVGHGMAPCLAENRIQALVEVGQAFGHSGLQV